MPDPNEQDDDDPNGSEGLTPDGTTTQPTNGAPPGAPAGAAGGQEEGVHKVKHSDWKRIKAEQQAKGRQQAITELDAQAQAAGFASHADALKALAAIQKQPPTRTPTPSQGAPTMPKTPPTKNTDPAREAERLRAEQVRASDDKVKMRKQWKLENRKNRDLQQQLAAKDAEMGLREECYRAGVADVDYMIRLLTRELQGKTQEEIEQFDRNAFYAERRKDKPYLFGEHVVPANTGTGGEVKNGAPANGGAAPTPPAPGSTQVVEAEKKKFDARTAKPEEVQARLRELGLNPHL